MSGRVSLRTIPAACAAMLLVAACGSSNQAATHAAKPRGPAYQTSTVAISTERCGAGAGRGHCVVVLSDGARYRCPQAQTSRLQTAAAVEHASICTKLKAVAIPAAWKPVLKHLTTVRGCLSRAGLTVTGGATLGLVGRSARTPIGELTLVGTSAPTLINFYESTAAASAAAPGLHANSIRSGGSTLRHGTTIIAWSSRPEAGERASERLCLRG